MSSESRNSLFLVSSVSIRARSGFSEASLRSGEPTWKGHLGVEDHAHGVFLVLLLEGRHAEETLVEQHAQRPEVVPALHAVVREERVGGLAEFLAAQLEALVSPPPWTSWSGGS